MIYRLSYFINSSSYLENHYRTDKITTKNIITFGFEKFDPQLKCSKTPAYQFYFFSC